MMLEVFIAVSVVFFGFFYGQTHCTGMVFFPNIKLMVLARCSGKRWPTEKHLYARVCSSSGLPFNTANTLP